MRVEQGEIWKTKKENNPYFFTSMSECSTIVGMNENEIAVAHISYSELEGTRLAIRWMIEQNLNNIFAITNEGPKNQHLGKEEARRNDYLELGIPEKHIFPFEYFGRDGLHRNLTQVITNKDNIFVYSFDGDPQQNHKRVGGLHNPRIIAA